jgi:hypothetical protein
MTRVPGIVHVRGHAIGVSGRWPPFSRPAAIVTTLKTEPVG